MPTAFTDGGWRCRAAPSRIVESRCMPPDIDPGSPAPFRFASQPPERHSIPVALWAGGALVLLLLLLSGLLLVTGRKPASPRGTLLPANPYASHLLFTDLQMSESTSLSGGKSTFIDGHVTNDGTQTVTAATVQVLFANDLGLAAQVETLPLTLIRTHDPYVDTQPLSAAPLAPGSSREFRLIFESIGDNWNQQLPQIRVVAASLRPVSQ